MSIDRARTIEWDGNALGGWVAADGTPPKISVGHNPTHTPADGVNDAQTSETKSVSVPANLYLPGRWNWGPAISSHDWY